jgi:hypothetical protein
MREGIAAQESEYMNRTKENKKDGLIVSIISSALAESGLIHGLEFNLKTDGKLFTYSEA